jgi:hypothetical protein
MEEHRLRVFENRELGRIFGSNGVRKGWQAGEHSIMRSFIKYCYGEKSWRMRLVGHVARME